MKVLALGLLAVDRIVVGRQSGPVEGAGELDDEVEDLVATPAFAAAEAGDRVVVGDGDL